MASTLLPRYAGWDLPTAARRVEEGLPVGDLETLRDRLGVPTRVLAHILSIAPRTLSRRMAQGRLPADESDRLYRITRLTDLAAQVLGGDEAAVAWMKEPNIALGEETPLEVARTEPGARMVEQVLGRIEHGIPV